MERKENKKNLKLPALRLRYRIFLYFAAVFFAALSFFQIAMEYFGQYAEIAIYLCAAFTVFPAALFIGPDIVRANRACIRFVENLADRYQRIRRFVYDDGFRAFITTSAGLLINIGFAVFHGVIGFISRSPWYITLAVYYFSLSCMRSWAVNYGRKVSLKDKNMRSHRREIRIYKASSIYMILLTIVLGGMVILTVHSAGGKHYPGMSIYIVALYTFIKVPLAVWNLMKTTQMKTPLLVTIRSIGYADACVSVLSLQTAMFASFWNEEMGEGRLLMNGITGLVVCFLVLSIGIYGVFSANKMKLQSREEG